jgi:hypothetical protein
MRILSAAALLCMIVLLAGCFEFQEEIWVNRDGSGRVAADLGISETLLAMGALGGGDPGAELRQSYADGKRRAEADPNVKSVKLTENSAEGMHHFLVDVSLKKITELGGTLDALSPNGDAFGDSAPTREAPPFRLERLRNGDLEFRLSLDMPDRRGGDESGADDEWARSGEEFGQAMALSVLSGRYFTVILHAPRFISTNGEVDKSGKTCTWRISLADLMAHKGTPSELAATIDMPNPLLPLIAAAATLAVIAALALIGASLARMRRRTRALAALQQAGSPPESAAPDSRPQ